MTLSRSRPALRRLALALATAQLVAYAAVPVVEGRTERVGGPEALERNHTATCVVLHSPISCLACQLLSAHGQRAAGASVPASWLAGRATAVIGEAFASLRPADRSLHSRAPPHLA
jgi:hypothetical protein